MLYTIFLKINPAALLISVLYVLGELNKSNEIIAMRSSGISIIKISLPYILFSTIISLFAFFIQEKLLIHSHAVIKEIENVYLKDSNRSDRTKENISIFLQNTIIYAKYYYIKDYTLENVQIIIDDAYGNIKQIIDCAKIRFYNGYWEGYKVITTSFNEKGESVKNFWEKKIIDINIEPHKLLYYSISSQELSNLKTLRKEIRALKKTTNSKELRNKIVLFHRKIVEPLSGLFLVIGVLPLGLEIKQRKIGFSSLGIGFLIYLFYSVIFSLSLPLGKLGIIFPSLSPWLAPIFFIIMGIIGLRYIR